FAAAPPDSSERVTNAVHGCDRRSFVECAQLAAQASDVGVKRVRMNDRAVRPAGADQVAPTYCLGRTGEQTGEQSELGRRQRRRVRAAGDRVSNRVETQAGSLEHTVDPGPPRKGRQTYDAL